MLTLDAQSVVLEYLAEGAANVIYRIYSPSPSPSLAAEADLEEYDEHQPTEISLPPIHPSLPGKLLRLRKDIASAVGVFESHRQFHKMIVPLFSKDNLVEQELVKISSSLVEHVNQDLKRKEAAGNRPVRRHGVYLVKNEEFGYLITDMSCELTTDTCIEIKPKWLAQSPSAPKSATRCRTCALRAMKHSAKKQLDGEVTPSFCPLGLVSKGRADATTTISSFLSQNYPAIKGQAALCRRIVRFLEQNQILHHLKALQEQKDPLGVLKGDVFLPDFLIAMTIRDCTLFLKIPKAETDDRIEARLGDLDLKSPDGEKAQYWKSIEESLIENGWYTGTEDLEMNAVPDKICMLSTVL